MKIKDGVLLSINKSKDVKRGKCIIPDSVTSIGDYAFAFCSGLTSITIPDSVTSIGSSAFSHCSGLTSITIPDGVTSIGSFAFEDCSSLKRLTIPKTIKKIKCVKGFYRDGNKLKCRDFVYEVGKTYKEKNAKLCKSGFHACTLGLDVFNYYVGEGVVYYEVELSGLSYEKRDDSKICGTTITLLRGLTVAEAANYKASLEKPD